MSFIEIEFAGKELRLDTVNGTDQAAQQLSEGNYEPPLPFLMMALFVRIEGAFIDVGANTGVYSVITGVVAPKRRIFAFEPLPDALTVLHRNLDANGLTDRVVVHPLALSDKPGQAVLHLPDPAHGLLETSASLEAGFKAGHPPGDSITVEVTTLDEMSIPGPIGIIKADIEGHEHAFLRGAKETMLRERPFVFVEVLHNAQRHAIRSVLRETDYINFRLRPDLAIHDGGEVVFDHLAWNHALIPVERLQKFKDACDSCGVELVRRFSLN